jgi:hypothetical protein
MSIYLMNCARVIEDEIASKARQADVAVTYALAMRAEAAGVWTADWPRVNKAILDRWSMTGLKRVKKLAHQKHREMPT